MAKERLMILLAGVAVLTVPAVAQEDRSEQEVPDTEAAAEEEADASDDIDLLDDSEFDAELDAQGFDPNADDDFIPSEEIPADEPIAFPTDI